VAESMTILCLLGLALTLLYRGRGYWAWVIPGALLLALWAAAWNPGAPLFAVMVVSFLSLAVILGVGRIRRRAITNWIMASMRRALPHIGDTERIALEAGTVGWEGELFTGNPDWQRLLSSKLPRLSATDQAFLDGPVEELCALIDDWKIEEEGDLPAEVWAFMRANRFFGMVIPTEYDGLGMCALAHSAVVTKIASRSVAAAVTVMVPNSLGPAELLVRYGTDEQKRQYLPRLAVGDEIPCFALTGPEAGSDAAATQSTGVVCRGRFRGEEVLGMRLCWRKRYITLGPVATVIGLAFRLHDPEHLLGDKEDLGITCALIPPNLPGVEIGRRHDPLGIAFQNGPTSGLNVFVPIEFIIGGRAMAGQGWRMLMECLAAGRAISLPALSVGLAEVATRIVGAYATIREQFDTQIGRFEGIEEPLARIGGLTYLGNAARTLTAGAVDMGERPAVASAIVKAYLTEAMRVVINDAMDVQAGAAICRGPRNTLARAFMAGPIGITVEGANILTRTLIIYGQGAIRCHPYLREEIEAVEADDLERFDRTFFGHVGFVGRNLARAFLLGITNGRLARPAIKGQVREILARLTRMSTAFALVSEGVMATLGGGLKRHEKISGRLADALAWQYLASAAVKRFWDEGQLERDLPFVRWAGAHSLFKVQEAILGILDNLPSRPVAWALRRLVFPLGAWQRPPSDALGAEVARSLLDGHEGRLHLTSDIYVPRADEPGLGQLEAALARVVGAMDVEVRIHEATSARRIGREPRVTRIERALSAGIITDGDARRARDADNARDEVIQVDAFDPAEARRKDMGNAAKRIEPRTAKQGVYAAQRPKGSTE